MQALGRAAQGALRGACRTLATLSEAAPGGAARWGGALMPSGLVLEAYSKQAATGFPQWATAAAAAAAVRQQPSSLSGLAAASLAQPLAPAMQAPQQQHGILRQLEQLWADSVRRKRKRAMNKHKHRKRRKLNRMSSRR
ncbi:hypothetical protein COHA_000934 [Chlorella ohadii]|uniref:Small ribosomal subunit protein mS38 n=1 Tax=Chlorella ohadii TaxID=2649997 RepID=A0AAD5H6B7_9CHLO|nr:hypothetical protein COHA_000934 [Chlorella ohadii]